MRLVSILLLMGVSLSVAHPATADDDPGTEAIALGAEGLELFQREQWDEALQHFRRAELHYHSPVFLLYMARCLRNLGQDVEARAVYQRIAEESLDVDAPPPFHAAKRDAATELEDMPKPSADASPEPSAPPRARPTSAETTPTNSAPVESKNPKVVATAREADGSAVLITGIAATVAGSLSLTAGVATAILAAGSRQRADDLCPDLACTAEGLAAVERGRNFATASTASFIAGSVVTSAGILMLIVPMLVDDDATTSLHIEIRPSGATLRIAF